MKWIIYQRGTIYPYTADMLCRALFMRTEKLAGRFVGTLYINLGPKLFWSWRKADMERLIKIVLKKISQPRQGRLHLHKLFMISQRAIRVADKLRRTNLKNFSSKQKLIKQYTILDQTLLSANGLLGVEVDAIDIGFENFFIKQLGQASGLKDEALIEVYKKIARPLYQSYVTMQEIEIIQSALKNKIADADIEKVYQKFWWTNLGWENIISHAFSYFKKAILKYQKLDKQELKNRLVAINEQQKVIARERKELVKQYRLGKNILRYLKVIDGYSLIHDLRKECQVKTIYAYYLLTREIARRLKFDVNDLLWLRYSEVKELLNGKKLDNKEIERRKKAIAILVSKQGIKIWSGQEALDLCQKELQSKNQNVKELKGRGVTSGKVKGRAKVCQGMLEALRKIKSKQDILICPMTLPDYLPAMKRAGAIVTDEGGVTCHAAIIAREFKIPCVVGTKIATQVFKDGDLVEVDANQGRVRKIDKLFDFDYNRNERDFDYKKTKHIKFMLKKEVIWREILFQAI